MAKIKQGAVYNSPILYILITRSSSLRAAIPLLVILILWCQGIGWAGDWGAPEQQLTAKIMAVVSTGPATVEVSNRSSLGQAEVEAIRRGLIERLTSLGLKLSNTDSASSSIRIFLSENLQEYVWVAEIRKGANEPIVVMVSRSRANAEVAREIPAVTLRKSLLWSSDTQILDAVVINGASPRMAVLYPGQIQFYRLQNDQWLEDQAFPVNHSHPWPRDLRGRLILRKDRSVEVHVPGVMCQSNAGSSLSVSCREIGRAHV